MMISVQFILNDGSYLVLFFNHYIITNKKIVINFRTEKLNKDIVNLIGKKNCIKTISLMIDNILKVDAIFNCIDFKNYEISFYHRLKLKKPSMPKFKFDDYKEPF